MQSYSSCPEISYSNFSSKMAYAVSADSSQTVTAPNQSTLFAMPPSIL